MAIILGANSAAVTGYNVDNSARWNRADSPYMHQTFSGAGNRDKWTFSCWVKKCSNGVEQRLLTTSDNSTFDDNIRFNSDDTFNVICNNATVLTTNRVFRDNSAFYHICVIWDSGNGTSGNRCLLYVNGIRETSFGTESYPSSGQDSYINNNTPHYIGVTNATANSHHLHGYLAEVVFQNDNADSPVDKFGEFDEDSPIIFKPIDVSELTLGTNGTYLDFADSSNLGNDIGGGTDWTEVNFAATDQTTDTPTLNYMTLNPLSAGVGDVARIPTFSEGNTVFTSAGSNTFYQAISTFGVAVSKWYFEVKVASDQDLDKLRVGYWNIDKNVSSGEIQDVSDANSAVFYQNKDGGEMRLNATSTTADYGTFADDELMGVAIDMDAQTITILKANSVIVNAYDYSGGIAAGTVLTPAFMGYDDTAMEINFGNPSYANSSDAADENGYGAFEFAPPSGHLAFNSANLGSDGG